METKALRSGIRDQAEGDQVTWKTIAMRTYTLGDHEQLPQWTETGLYNLKGCRRAVEDGNGTMATKRSVRRMAGAEYVTEELRFKS